MDFIGNCRSHRAFCFAFLSLLLLASCGEKTTTEASRLVVESGGGGSRPWNTENMEQGDTFLLVKSKKWKYENLNLSISEISADEVPDESRLGGRMTPVIELELESALLVEDPKSSKPTAINGLAEFALQPQQEGDKIKRFRVNERNFTGRIDGFTTDAKGVKTLQLRLFVYEGEIVHKAMAWSDKGKVYSAPHQQVVTISSGSVRKPIIYLYPTQKQTVSVQVDFKGRLTHTYPAYDAQKGWEVVAKPDGELTNLANGKTYYSLFWEGESSYQYDMRSGFVVRGSETAAFLDEKLERLGLNRREAGEFITYWLPELEKNAYNLIHFSTEEYSAQAPLRVSPKPDTEIRVFMVYQPLKNPIDVQPQTLKTVARKGFTLVEWGGKIQVPVEQ